jgi:ribosomal protein L32
VLLDKSQVSAVVDHLGKSGVNACPACGRKEWEVSDRIFVLPEYLPSFSPSPPRGEEPGYRRAQAPQAFPVVAVVCPTCGHVFFLSAMALKIVNVTKQAA